MGVSVIATDNGMRPPGVHLILISNLDALVSAAASLLTSGTARPPQPALSAPATTGLENLEAVAQFYLDLSQAS